jgi:hypothetical protein
MGFIDRAKKLAEQAQEKLDEAQKSFNQSQSPPDEQVQSVRYDEHGRPIQQEETPAAATPPPSATPPAAEAPAEEQPEGDADANPDPFKPIQ